MRICKLLLDHTLYSINYGICTGLECSQARRSRKDQALVEETQDMEYDCDHMVIYRWYSFGYHNPCSSPLSRQVQVFKLTNTL